MLKRTISIILFLVAVQNSFAQCYSLLTYCSPTVINDGVGTSMGLQNVTFGTTINNTTVATGGYPHYYDYTNFIVSGSAGSKILGSVKNGGGNSTMVRIYVDWNQDGVYGTTAPELAWASGNSAAGAVVNDSITIPVGQAPGLYRIRVQGNFGSGSYGTTGTVNPCVVDYGEVEEYTLAVTTSTADAASLAHTSPSFYILGNNTVGFSMVNLTNSTMTSVNIGYKLGSNTAVTESMTGLSIAAGALYTVNFATQLNIAATGTYALKVWLNNVNGGGTQTPVNDTICKTLSVYCSTALSGTYTIDPSGSGSSNFTTIGAADSAMLICGVSGPVVFNVAAGTYNQQIDIPIISGASATNTITFDGGNGNASTRVLTASTTSALPYVLRFNGSSYVTFRNMTIRSTGTTDAWVTHFLDGTNNRLNNCIIEITGTGATSTNSNLAGIVFNGSSTTLSTSSSLSNNHTIDSCTINAGYYNIYCSTSNGSNTLNFNNNNLNSAYYYGMSFNSSITAKIRRNTIDLRNNNTSNTGIYFINCSANGTNFHEIVSNKITNAGQYGMYFLTSNGSSSSYGQIYNNMIGGGFRNTSGCYGINDNSSRYQIWHNSINMDFNSTSGTTAAIYLNGGSLHDIQNNHLVVSATTASNAFALYTSASTNISTLDYNNYFNVSSSNLYFNGVASYNTANFRTAFSAGGAGVNSINSNPFYISALNLHTTMPCNNGANLGLTSDFDGNSRGTTPDIGADEVSSIPNNDFGMLKLNSPSFPLSTGSQTVNVTVRNFGNNTITTGTVYYSLNGGTPVSQSWSGTLAPCDTANISFTTTITITSGVSAIKVYTAGPNGVADANTANDTLKLSLCPALMGAYTINPLGSGSTNYVSFASAISDMQCAGIKGSVVFNVVPGTYTTQFTVPSINGASATNTITFRSATGIASNVVLNYSSIGTADNYIAKMDGGDYFKFSNLTFAPLGINYGTAVLLQNSSDYNVFDSCVFNGLGTTSTSQNLALFYSNNTKDNYNIISNCLLNNGAMGVYWYSNSVAYAAGNQIIQNTFSNQYYSAIYTTYHDYLRIRQNLITTSTAYTSYYGIFDQYTYNNSGATEITKNKIFATVAGGYGMYNYYPNFGNSTTYRFLVANNMIQMNVTSTSASYGIYNQYVYTADIMHNTVNMVAQPTGTSYAYYNYYFFTSGCFVQNNVFTNSTTGTTSYAVYEQLSNSATWNNNLYYTMGTNLGSWSGSLAATLAAWRTFNTGQELNSISLLPSYTSSTDLSFFNLPCANNAGANVLTRVPDDINGIARSVTPDLGAVEYTPASLDAGAFVVRAPLGSLIVSNSYNVVVTARNFGTTTITSLVVGYRVNNGTAVTQTISSLNMLPCDTLQVTFSATSGPGATDQRYVAIPGLAAMKAFTASPNGGADLNALNDTTIAISCSQLSGTFTINKNLPASNVNFTSVTNAVSALYSCGVNGPVVLNITSGSGPYNEQITFNGPINGVTAATNNVTINGGTSKEVISFNASVATNQHTIRLSNVKGIILNNITINAINPSNGIGVHITSSADSNIVQNCVFNIAGSTLSNTAGVALSTTASPTGTGANGNVNRIQNNTINGGYYGITANGTSLTVENTYNYILNNTISNAYYYGIFVQYQNFHKSNGNIINLLAGNVSSMGVYFNYVDAFELKQNNINNVGQYGIQLNNSNYQNNLASPHTRAGVVNNMIGGNFYNANPNGLYLVGNAHRDLDILHNSISINNAGSGSAFWMQQTTTGMYTNLDIRNNSFVTYNGTSYACYFYYSGTTAPFLNFNYNNIWNSATAITQVYLNNTTYTTNAWITAGGYNNNSKWLDPKYINPLTNLHSVEGNLSDAGTNIATVIDDIDGDARPIIPAGTVDIGADEYIIPPLNIGAVAITSPIYPIAPGLQNVVVLIKNSGTATITSANVTYKVGVNGTLKTVAFSGSITSGNTALVTFTGSNQYNFTGPRDTVIAYTSAPNGGVDAYLPNDTATSVLCVALSGAYTVNPLGSGSTNFTTMGLAVATLVCGGVTGPVTFNVAAGTYNEQINIGAIAGSSNTNTVTFIGAGNSTVLTFPTTAANPHVVRMNGTRGIFFKNMKLQSSTTNGNGWIVNFIDAKYCGVSNSTIEFSDPSGQTSTSSNMAGVVVNGSTSAITTASVLADSIYVDSNNVNYGYYNVMFASNNATFPLMFVRGDSMTNAYFASVAFPNQNQSLSFRVLNNKITLRTLSSVPSYAVYDYTATLTSGKYKEISGNRMSSLNGYGIGIYNSGASPTQSMIYNNIIGGSSRGTTQMFGVFNCCAAFFNYWSIFNNTFIMDWNAGTSYGINLQSMGSSTNGFVRNNIFVNTSTTANNIAINATNNGSIATLDNNIYYSSFPNGTFATLAGVMYDANNYKSAYPNGLGLNSFNVLPNFVSASDFHLISNCSKGANLGVTADFDGNTRASVPDIGADEISNPLSNDIGVLKINSPAFPFAPGSQNINVTIRNFGSNTITSGTIKYQVNGGSVVSGSFTGSLAQCDTLNFTFTAPYTFTAGANTIKVFTSLPNGNADANNANDTVLQTFCPAFGGVYTINPSGGAYPNYTSIASALSDLNCGGVYAPVTFNIASGTYTGQNVVGGYVRGLSAINNVTFQSATGVASDVILTNSSTASGVSNYTLKLNGASFYKFRNLTISATNTTYGTALSFAGATSTSSTDTFYNVVFNGVTSSTNTTDQAVIYSPNTTPVPSTFLYFDACKVNNGFFGSYFYSGGNIGSTENLTFNNCDFTNQYGYGMYNYQLNGLILNRNRITTNSAYTTYNGMYNYWIYITAVSNRPIVNGNKISGSVGGVGMFNTYFGVNSGTTGKRPIISNNMISIGSGANSTFGLQVVNDYGSDYINNSVNIGSTLTTNASAAAYFQSVSSSIDSVVNNIFVGSSGSPAIRCDATASFSPCNYNDLFTTGANLGYISATAYTTMALWRTGSGRDANSINITPGFAAFSDLHLPSAVNLLPVSVHPLVQYDYDNTFRCSSPTDIGADHHAGTNDIGVSRLLQPLNGVSGLGARDIIVVLRNFGSNTITSANVSYTDNTITKTISWSGTLNQCDSAIITFTGANQYTFTGAFNMKFYTDSPNGITDANKTNDTIKVVGCIGLSGAYTINPTGTGPTNFTSFTTALAAMTGCGIVGPVTFTVSAGTYTEQISIPVINGLSAINTITFDGGVGNASTRILTYTPTAALPYIWRFNATQFVTVRNMTIRGTDATNAWNVNFLNAVSCKVSNCILDNTSFGATGTSSNVHGVVLNGNATSYSTSSTIVNDNYVDSCTISIGYSSIMCYLNNANNTNYFRYNTMTNFYVYGMYATGAQAVKFLNNSLSTRNPYATNSYSLYLSSCTPAAGLFNDVSNNKFSPVIYAAMYITSCSGNANSYSIISNNMIYSPYLYPSNSYGIYLSSDSYWKVYHNSINYVQTGTYAAYGMYISSGSFLDVRNNILASTDATATAYTPFYVNAASVLSNLDNNIYYNVGSTTLVSIAGVNYGASTFKTVAGVNSLNINPTYITGTNLHIQMPCNNGANLGVAKDIDGDVRSTSPDIGADEMTNIASNDIGVMKINSPSIPYAPGTQTINVTLRNLGANTVTTASVNYRLNGGSVVTETWSGILNSCDTANFTFTTTSTFPLGSNNLITYTSSPNGTTDANNSNDTAQWTICTGMIGAYTINPTGSGPTNFTTFTAAANALGCGGVYGPVTITVAANTYIEQVSIPFIAGASAINTVTFEGFNAATRIIAFAPTAALPYVLRFNTCNYVTFRNFTIRGTGATTTWVTHFLDGTNNRVSKCIIDFTGTGVTSTATTFVPIVVNGHPTTINGSTLVARNHMVDSSSIYYGYYGAYTSLTTDSCKFYLLSNNFIGVYQYGYYAANGAFSPRINYNTFNMRSGVTGSTTNQGIFIQSCSNTGSNYMDVSANKVLNPGQYGIQLSSCTNSGTAFNLVNNNMIGGGFTNLSTTSGIYFTTVSRTLLYHNSVNMDAATSGGINAAIYINAGSGNDIRNNNLMISNASALSAFPIYLSATSVITTLDYNNYYNVSSVNLLSFAGTNYNLSNYKGSFPTGGGANSISFNPYYVSALNLHTTNPCSNAVGLGVNTDIDGEVRTTTPDIGADEITNVPNNDIGVMKVNAPAFPLIAGSQVVNVTLRNYGNNIITTANVNVIVNGGTVVSDTWTGSLAPCDTANFTFTAPYIFSAGTSIIKVYTSLPNASADAVNANDTIQISLCSALSGVYTINPTGSGTSNYTTFTKAIAALTCGGIVGPVVFNVAAATYTEQLVIPIVPGATTTNTVTFDGGNGNIATRIITFSGSAAIPATVYLNSSRSIIFRNLTIQSTGVAQGWGVNMFNASSCRINNCFVEVAAPGNTSTGAAFMGIVISGGNTTGTYSTASLLCDNNTIDSSTVKAGYYGIYTSINNGSFTNYFIKNTIINQYQGGVYCTGAQNVKCNYNTINLASTNNSSSDAITLTSVNPTGALFIDLSNNIISFAGRYGIYLPSSAGSGSGLGQIYNNFIGGGFTNAAASGIYISSSRWNVWHNTVNLDAPITTTAACIYFAGGSVNDVRNNIFTVTNTSNANAFCLYTASTTYITTLDYNNYFNALGANLLNLGGTLKTSTTFKTAFSTGGGLFSVNFNPAFVSGTNLHILGGCNNGTNLGLTNDFDGDSRGATPDMGADEIPVYALDAMVSLIRTPIGQIVTGGTPYTVKLLVRNNGTTTITSLDASFDINGVATTQTFTTSSGLPAAGLVACDTVQLTFTSTAIFSAGGPGFFKAYTGNINGSADQFHGNDTLSNLFCTPFAGNFTINSQGAPSGTNFTSFSAAVTAIYNCGVAGPVVFRAVPGSGPYNEQLTFTGAIPGVTAINNVTFKGGANKEAISFNSGVAASQHTIRLSGVKHIILDSLTINALNVTNGIGVNITNIADSNYVQNCVINVAGTTSGNTAGIAISTTASPTGAGNNGNKNIILNNTINGGYIGISALGTSTATFCRFNQIIGNTLSGAYQYGMYIQYQDTIKMNSNNIVGMSNLITSGYGMYLAYIDRFELKKNKINNVGTYGIYFSTNANYQNNLPLSRSYIVNNMVGGNFYASSGYAIYLGSNSRELDIQHNSVSVFNGGSIYPFFMQQTSLGQYTGLDVRNNIFSMFGGTTGYCWFYYSVGTPFNFFNNNNVYNSTTTATTIYIGTSGYGTTGYIGALGWNSNSKWLDPLFINNRTNLHTLAINMNDVGVNIPTVIDDIDGDPRPISPSTVVDIGADEYNRPANDAGIIAIVSPAPPTVAGLQDVKVLLKNFGTNTLTSANVYYKAGYNGSVKSMMWTGSLATNATAIVTFTTPNQYNLIGTQADTIISWTSLPNGLNDDYKNNDTTASPVCVSMAGSYTINPAGSGVTNFLSFNEALQKLYTCGVGAPVTITVAPGVYTGRLIINTIPNATALTKVTFDGVDSALCKIVDAVGGTAAQPAVLTFVAADYITFKNFDILSTGASIGVGVLMNNGSDYNTISRCNIRVPESTASNNFGVGVCGISYSTGGINGNYNTFESCAIIGGYVGASLYGSSTTANDVGNAIRNCTITNMYQYGIYSYYEYLDSIIGNKITFRLNAVNSNTGMYFYYNNGMRVERNIITNAGAYGIYSYYTNYSGVNLGNKAAINNNILITNNSYASPIPLYAYYPYNTEFYYNTAFCGGNSSTSSYAANISYGANGTDVKNNIFYNNNTVSAYALNVAGGTFNTFDYNIMYTASLSNYVIWLGTTVTDLPSLKALSPTFHQKSLTLVPNFVSTSALVEDLHLTSNVAGQSADKTVPIFVDVDNDARCVFSPTIGADESRYNSGNPTAAFTSPDTVFVNDLTTFLNNNLATAQLGHRWYVNGVLVGSSVNVQYTFNATGTYAIKLVTYGCVGIDSITKTITVYNPTRRPVADFVADRFVVETYQQIQLTDLSTNGPSYWYWTITPNLGINYNNGTSNTSKNPVISFSNSGYYEVCLWDSNAIGRSPQICKTAYIKVNATNQLCIFPFDTKVASGVLYDDGGPTGNYSLGSTCNFLIDPCASSVNIVFSAFNLAGSAYIRIYDGKNNLAPPLHTGLGFTGTAIPGGAAGITALSGKMYIEFVKGGTAGPGFAATWSSVASSSPAPVGKLSMPDTAYDCGAMTTFSYVPSKLSFDKDGAIYRWWFDYANSNAFPDVEMKGLYSQDWAYGSLGTYIIRCDIEGCGGIETLYDTIEIVHPTTGPITNFKADLLVATPNDVVNFTDLSKIDPIWWQWTITGPGPVTGVTGGVYSKNYGVQFTTPGLYTVTLLDSNCVGSNSMTKTSYIRVIDYCTPVVNVLNADFAIERFTLGRADTIINNTVYGLDYKNTTPAVGSVTYRDNTNKLTTYVINNVSIANTPVVALLGLSENIGFNVKRQSNFNRANFKIWIDWDQDGVFQASELTASSGITSGINYSGQIAVPINAKLGPTRLRIGTNFDSLTNTPCGINAFGDFNDFRVIVTPDITPPAISVAGNVDTVFVEVGRTFVDPGVTVTGATTVTHTGLAFNSVVTTYPSLSVHTITASDLAGNTTIRDIYVRATRDVTKPTITRNGTDTVYQEVKTAYVDAGATANDFYFGSLTSSIVTTSTVNVNVLGTYTVTYKVTDAAGNAATPFVRTVIVRDTQKPVIIISGSNPVYVNVHNTFNAPTASVTDNYNTGLTYTITGGPVNTSILGTYLLYYNAKDSSGNVAVTQILTVIVRDITPPRLTLLPSDTVIIDCITMTSVPEPGYIVNDNYYASSQITVSKVGTVNLNIVGNYVVRYYATDPSGNVDSASVRVYKVVDREAPVISLVGSLTMNWPRWKPFVDPGTTVFDKCDPGAVVTKDMSNLNIQLDGLYHITYACTDASGNVANTIRRYVNIFTPVGINVNGNNNLFMVYPNPNNGLVNIEINIEDASYASILIFDANGKEIYTRYDLNPLNNKVLIDLSNEAAGIYFVKLVTDKFTSSKSFSIQK